MRDIINYFYEIRIDKIANNEEVCIIESKNNLYIFKKILNFNNTLEILEKVKINYFKVIPTRNGQFYCNYNNNGDICIYKSLVKLYKRLSTM